jgi:cytochrome c-type biogenesis protein CcmF
MENALLLMAVCFVGTSAVLSFLFKQQKVLSIVLKILWSLAAVCIFVDIGLMVAYIVEGKFNFNYVYNHTDKGLAILYKVSALWSGQEGSFLLWAATLAFMGFFILWGKWNGSHHMFGIFSFISLCIFVMCFISQPFAQSGAAPGDGAGMAEVLQDPWMVAHPPLVFIAYSIMAVLAAHSVALSREPEPLMVNRILNWVRISWVFLGLGIFTGSVWAYRALGWGGYWAWDPIENAALVPWLMMCGYLHVKGKINRTRCVLPFVVACFGTFLTRSGILNEKSTHAYTQGNTLVSVIILGLLLSIVCWLIITRLFKKKETKKNTLKDLAGNIRDKKLMLSYIIYGYALFIFLGTIAPLIINIDTPMEFYLVISIIFVLAYTVLLLTWDLGILVRKNLWMMAISTVFVIVVALATHTANYGWLVLLWMCLMPLSLWIVSGFGTQNWKFYLLHIGMVLMIAGTITSSGLSKEMVVISQSNSARVNIDGSEIDIDGIQKKDVIIVQTLAEDIIVKCTDIQVMSDGSLAIPIVKKPMIILFWLGGFTMILSPCAIAIAQKVKSDNAKSCMLT